MVVDVKSALLCISDIAVLLGFSFFYTQKGVKTNIL